ncbi:MAG: helix-turn-helix domain-containing protein [Nannocystaceae bacterium]
MELSIKEAAEVLGKSERTVRHMAQTGRLPARRIGSRWVISRDDLDRRGAEGDTDDVDLDDEAVSAADHDDADDADDLTVTPIERPTPRSETARRPTLTVSFEAIDAEPGARDFPSSIRELDSFAVASGLLGEVADARRRARGDGAALLAEPERALRGVLQTLADGCHQPDARHRAAAFREAQTQACAALSGLVHYTLLHAEPDLRELAERVESELLTSLAAHRARHERRLTWRGRVITAAEVALERIIHRAKTFGAGRFADRLDHVERSLHRALRHAL